MDKTKIRVISQPVLVGHPLAPIGRGEDIRSSFRCLQKAGCAAAIYDVSPPPRNYPDSDLAHEFEDHLVRSFSSKINIFYLNGDEIGDLLDRVAGNLPAAAYNIIYPQWELGKYPQPWSEQLNRFDEVWAPTRFVFQSLQKSTAKLLFYLPMSAQVDLTFLIGRKYFRIPEDAYLFLFCFDFRSYISRKHPYAVVRAFEKVCDARQNERIKLVIKFQGAESVEKGRAELREFLRRLDESSARDRIVVIDELFADHEIKNLIRCCDCFVSLHRSEGFGRGIAEAMFLGKPVVATGYSGNLDFMNENNSCLVRFQLVGVGKDCYPFWENQVWAEPDIDHAVSHMLRLVDDQEYGRVLGGTASRFMRTHFSTRAIGLRYRKRIDEIYQERGEPGPTGEISPRAKRSGIVD